MSGRDGGARWAVPLLFVAALAVALTLWRFAAGGGSAAPEIVDSDSARVSPAAGTPSGVPPSVPAEAGRAPVAGGRDTARVTRCVVVAADDGDPIEGATLRLTEGGRLVGTTDADGAVTVPDHDVQELVFWAPGYLVAYFSPGERLSEHMAADGERRYRVALEPDRYSIPFALRFVGSDGGEPEQVRLRLSAEAETPRLSITVPRERIGPHAPVADGVLEAWRRHVLLSAVSGFEALPHHFGGLSNSRLFEGPAEIAMRFSSSGPYRLEAVSSAGEVALRIVHVTLGQRAPLVIELAPGHTMKGIVSSALGGPVRGASVSMAPPWIDAGEATTGEAGEFELGPVPDEPCELDVRHHDFETVRTPPRRPTAPPQSIVLRPRARWEVRGVVRVRPTKKPVAGAEVAITWTGSGHEVRVNTGDDGWFSCVTTADEAEIVIRADGYREYAELVTRPAAPTSYDLLPATPGARVRAGLTAMLVGEVRGDDGEPRPGMTVQVLPDVPAGFAGVPGRRITRGGILSLPHAAATDDLGRFELECMVGGPARLIPGDGVTTAKDGLGIEVTLGRITDGLLVRARR